MPLPADQEVLDRLEDVGPVVTILDVAIALLGNDERCVLYARELLALGNRLVSEDRRSDDWPGNARALVVRIRAGRPLLAERGIRVRRKRDNRGSLLTFLRVPLDASFASLASLASLADEELNPFDDGDDVQFEPDPDDLVEEPFGEEAVAPVPPVEPPLPGENPFDDYEDLLPPGWDKDS